MKLEIQKMSLCIGKTRILSGIDVSLNFQVLGLIGPSGGGKSTLLKTIAGLLPPDCGTVSLDGKQIPFSSPEELLNHRRTLGVVFQSWNLFPHLSALENIVLPLYRVHGVPLEQARDEGRKLLDRFGLKNHADKKPYELSGGQCQRVAIIRAVATKPFLLLLDEPTSALDPLMTSEVLDLIVELKNEGIVFILCSHHMGFLEKTADQVAFISDGKWVESGPVKEVFRSPKHPAVIDYLSKVLKYDLS
jgi:polar amino acid transport system ATP-binding protein